MSDVHRDEAVQGATMTQPDPAFDQWCIVELLGHRRLAAHVSETTIAGAGFLRLDIPGGQTQLVTPSSVYALHPTTEAVVRALAANWHTEPISRWELPTAKPDEEYEPGPETDLNLIPEDSY